MLVGPMLAAIDTAALSAEAQAVATALEAWEFGCPTGLATSDPNGAVSTDPTEAKESIGCTAFHYLLGRVFNAAFGDELAASGAAASSDLLIRPLTLSLAAGREVPVGFDPGVLWDDVRTTEVTETREDILAVAFEDAAAALGAALGTTPDEWRWGRVHTITFASQVSELAKLSGDTVDLGPFANDGGLFTVDVANPPANATGKKFGHTSGASLRIVNELNAEGMTTWLQVPGGQDLHRESAHYGDLVDGWLANEAFVMPFTPAEEQAAARETIVVGP